jgi:hypothetical protein
LNINVTLFRVEAVILRAILAMVVPMFCSLVLIAQTATIMPLASEPHHLLSLHNEYVNVYQVMVAPHDSVLLHRHNFDAVSVMLEDAQVTVHSPGKPDTYRHLAAGQIRLQARGYVHSTTIDGNTTYRNITVELLLPQERKRNLCSAVIPDEPLNCPASESGSGSQLQFESDETSVDVVTVHAHQKLRIGHAKYPELAVPLDVGLAEEGEEGASGRPMTAGDFVWIEGGHLPTVISNSSAKESHLVVFTFRTSQAP